MLATVGHAQLHHPSDFLSKTDASRAVDASTHLFHRDQRPHILVEHHPLFLLVPGSRASVANCQILQLTFATLIADWAVQWVIDEQELHHRLLSLDSLFTVGADHHSLGHRGRASGHRLGSLFNVHQAHAAIRRDAQLLVIAKVGNKSARLLGRMHHHAALYHFNLLAVEFDFNHVGRLAQT